MTAGLPSTGVGSIFYFINVPVMICVELFHLTKGKSTKKAWKLIGLQSFMLIAMLANGVITGLALQYIFTNPAIQKSLYYISPVGSTNTLISTLPTNLLIATPFITLLFLFTVVFSLRVIFAAEHKFHSMA